MSKIAKIEEILNSQFKDANKFFQEISAAMRIEVDYSKCKSIQYKFDKELSRAYKGGLFPFFAKNKGVCRICDYLLFAELKGKVYCLLIELKRGNAQSLPQLNAAECFAEYINLTYNRIHSPQSEKFIIRKITIKEFKRKKKKTKMKDIEYDKHNHHIPDSSIFHLISYLK